MPRLNQCGLVTLERLLKVMHKKTMSIINAGYIIYKIMAITTIKYNNNKDKYDMES